jgi:hypothetical protein
MLHVLIDQNFDQTILRGLLRNVPNLDFITAYQAGLSEVEDPNLLIWAADNQRLLITHDRRTMSAHAKTVIESGRNIAGVVIVPRQMPIAEVIEQLELIVTCTEESEWQNVIRHLPL